MAVYYYILTSLVISFISFFSGISFVRKRFLDRGAFYLSIFFLPNGCIWLATAVATIFWQFGGGDLFFVAAFLSYVFVFLSGPGILGFALMNVFKNKKIFYIIYYILFLFFLSGVAFLYKESLQDLKITEWGAKSGLGQNSYFLFTISILMIAVFLIVSFLKNIKKGTSLVFLWFIFYLVVSYFDAGALVLGWQLVLTRIFMVAFLILVFFILFFKDRKRKNLFGGIKQG